MDIGWPEGILLTLMSLKVLVHLFNDGEQKPPQNANYNFAAALAGFLLSGILLYWGGFFA